MKSNLSHYWSTWSNTKFWYNTIYQIIETGQVIYTLEKYFSPTSTDMYANLAKTTSFYLTRHGSASYLNIHIHKINITLQVFEDKSNAGVAPSIQLISIYSLKLA